jgi:hypothetical protein
MTDKRPLLIALLTGLLLLAIFVATVGPLAAQQSATPSSTYCKDTAGFSDWDFWVGEWDVYSNDGARTHYGRNSVTKHYENCLIKETWESASGGGFSVNYFNPIRKEWRQVWVANAYSIDYTGGLNSQGQMVLEGEIYNYPQNTTAAFKGTWTAESGGDVVQRFEMFNAETRAWDVWFEGRYVRRHVRH